MGRRGPKPAPTAMLRLVGSREIEKRRGEIKPKLRIPSCPACLGVSARREWRRISKLLLHLGLLTAIDRAALAAYCDAYGRWYDATKQSQVHGMLTKSKLGALYQNPYLSIANRALGQMHRMLVEFGMTPSARAKLDVLDKGADDALSAFVKRKDGSA